MITVQQPLQESCSYDFAKRHPLDQILFFDIETTGLSADISSLYLIGCVYYKGSSWQLIQWFADGYHQEQELLEAFYSFSANFSVLLHYNGTGFDFPYLEKKCQQLHLDFHFPHVQSLDLYKKLLPFKRLLGLPSIRQKKVEELLGLFRQDKYSGGELISVYGSYLHGKIFREDPQLLEEKEKLLLLHNREDLTGLLGISSILSLEDLLIEEPEVTSWDYRESCLALNAILPSPLPLDFALEKDGFAFHGKKNTGKMEIPVTNGQLKLYFENYKDYFYLPLEDTAIHKSVAAFVDKEYRKKATKETCYAKIPVTESLLGDQRQLSQCFQRLISYYAHLK